jgi:hypothetical protein
MGWSIGSQASRPDVCTLPICSHSPGLRAVAPDGTPGARLALPRAMRNRLLLLGFLALAAACNGGTDTGMGGVGGGGGGGGGSSGSGSTSPDLATTPPAPAEDLGSAVDLGTAVDLSSPVKPNDLAVAPDLATVSDAAKFIGTWSYGAGAMATTNCPGQMPRDLSMTTFSVALKSGNTITFSAGAAINCSFDFTVSGTTATLVPNQSCNVTVSGTNATVTPDSGTMTTTDGVTGSLQAHAKVDGGLCTLTLSASSAKKM